jgi:hypothetical protein
MKVEASTLATRRVGRVPVRVNNGYRDRSSGTSVAPHIADDFGAPRKSSEVGQNLPSPTFPTAGRSCTFM